jgi:hypothetical protein
MAQAEALKAGKALLSKMKGRGWKVEVWKNGGYYHCAVRAPHVAVYPGGKGYFAMVSPEAFACGTPVEWHDDRYYRDPNVAARRAVEKARKIVGGHVKAIRKALEAVGEFWP